MTQKQEAVPVVPTDRDCWEEVMIDFKGRSNPADNTGRKYTMTYIASAMGFSSRADRSATQVKREECLRIVFSEVAQFLRS